VTTAVTDPIERPSVGPAPRPPFWRTAMPFVVGAALLAFVLGRLDYAAFFRHLRSTHYGAYAVFAVGFNVMLVGADSLAIKHVYNRTICPASYRELFVLRAASYLPSLLNYHVGQGWLTYFLSKTYGAPLWRVAGATLIVYVTVFGGLFTITLIGLPLNYERLPWLVPTLGAIGLAGLGYLVVLHLRPNFIATRAATAVLFDLGVGGHLLALVYRLPHLMVLFVGTWVPFLFLGVDIPFTHALALIPALMLVVSLPVSPQGIGTRDVFAQQLFLGYAVGTVEEQRAAVAAATLTWACAITLVQAVASPFFMRKAQSLLREVARRGPPHDLMTRPEDVIPSDARNDASRH
jgi:hypothetical protein